MADFLQGLPDDLSIFNIDGFVDDSSFTNICAVWNCDLCYSACEKSANSQEKSPFHESDSGMSESSGMSGSRATSTPSPVGPMLDELFDNGIGRRNPFFIQSPETPLSPSADLVGTEPAKPLGSTSDYDIESMLGLSLDLEPVEGLGNVCGVQESFPSQSDLNLGLVDQTAAIGRQRDELLNDVECLVAKRRSCIPRTGQRKKGKTESSYSLRKNRPRPGCRRTGSNDYLGLKYHEYVDAESEVFGSSIPGTSGSEPAEQKQNNSKSSEVQQHGSVSLSSSVSGNSRPSNSNANVTSVKVVRIVKAGNDSSGNSEEDITKALEERNRKNAEMARQNRLKKKAYIGNLEQELEDNRKKSEELESRLQTVTEERDSYKSEVQYLKSVLANQSALAGLLKNIPNVNGVTLSSVSRKRVAELDHCYVTPVKKMCSQDLSVASTAGVCLHVDNGRASLEFCHRCSQMASDQ